MVLFRLNGDTADYLVLADSFLVLEMRVWSSTVVRGRHHRRAGSRHQTPLRGSDGRRHQGTPEYERVRAAAIEGFRANRNQPGGFWVAKNDPLAADEAVVGSLPTGDLAGATLLSNGASRIVDRFGLADWPQVLALLGTAGPAEIIRRVREAEDQRRSAPRRRGA